MQNATRNRFKISCNTEQLSGVLDAGQKFHMIALAVSNKDDEEMSYWLLKAVKDSFQILDRNHTFTCTLADNSDTIQTALHRCFSLRFDWKLHV
jgi:hypothetical protein